jgi:hypothetical protein
MGDGKPKVVFVYWLVSVAPLVVDGDRSETVMPIGVAVICADARLV